MASGFVRASSVLIAALALVGCDKEEAPAPPAASASAKAPATAAVTAAVTASAAAPAPSATASAAAVPVHDCPAGSTGLATFDKPCEAKGTARAMEVTWTGKMDDKGPSFRVVNTTKDPILYGRIAVYFYDKAGKQLEAPSGGKPKPFHTCFGKLFGGVMKPAEKATITFSCVKKADVPEGAVAIEGEMQTVGFSDATEQKVDWYWRNADLSPDARKKGAK